MATLKYTTKEINEAIGPCPPWNPPVGEGSPFRPAGLYHTMLERVVPATLTGVLFYQGEEDSWRTKQYDTLLTSFIFQTTTTLLALSLHRLKTSAGQSRLWVQTHGVLQTCSHFLREL